MVTEDPLADETVLGVDECEEVSVPHYTLMLYLNDTKEVPTAIASLNS